MWFYIYNSSTGVLVSETNIQPTNLPSGLSYVSFSTRQNGNIWSPSSLTFSSPPNPSVIPTHAFVDRFAPSELGTIVASAASDPVVATALRTMQFYPTTDLADTVKTIPWVNYLASKGYITSARATEILTP